MAKYKNKFIEIDPETCSLEELKSAIDKMHELSGFYETKQLAIKLFLNSVYGATASKYFVGHSLDVAESITLQGQDLNHFSENSVNKYFSGIFQSEAEYNRVIYVPLFEYIEKYAINENTEFYAKNAEKQWVLAKLPISFEDAMNKNFSEEIKEMLKKVSVKTTFGQYLGEPYEKIKEFTINSGRLTKVVALDSYAKKAKNPLDASENPFAYMGKPTYLEGDPSISMIIGGDTDSVDGDSEIYLNGEKMKIKDAFDKLKYANHDIVLSLETGQQMIPVKNYSTFAFDSKSPFMPKEAQLKYIMRHKVSKSRYKIKTKSGKEVIVTGDHSCMICRDGKVIEVKAQDINQKTDKIVEIA